MLLFTDIISGDELASDVYKPVTVDDIVYEFDGAMIIVKDGDVNIGANPSAEEAEEALESGAEQKINIVHSFRLVKTSFDKKSYGLHLKGYMKAIKAELEKTNPERVASFESGAQAYAKKILADFKNFDFYTGESMNPDGMVLLVNYREDGVTPYFTVWKDGVKQVKL
ncbi:translationally controlled tumor-associated [Clavulina sp. PMI_390]|nr:translationally controlled tumor-associated [Clavulina sp. PMI_390]